MIIAEIMGLASVYSDAKQILVGTECEIESVDTGVSWNLPSSIDVTSDGSLRNEGREFLILPSTTKVALDLFKLLHRQVRFFDVEEKFSHRTSIHVHVNCKNLHEKEVKNVLYMYTLFEEFFFLMADESRRHNIHCVAVNDTFMHRYFNNDIGTLASRWMKYSALNLKPLRTLGTMEFRHMHGHDDPVLHEQWLGIIERLFNVGKGVDCRTEGLSAENIEKWFTEIFKESHLYAKCINSLPSYTKDAVMDLKLTTV